MVITRRKLLRLIDREKVKAAIEKAEKRTSGEICVSVARLFWGSAEKAADKAFARLGVHQTKQHNGVLFFVVPARRKFVIRGDSGIHEKVGQEFWEHLAAVMSEKFRDGDFTGGLVRAIEEVGEQFSTYFPYETDDQNELPDDIDFEGL